MILITRERGFANVVLPFVAYDPGGRYVIAGTDKPRLGSSASMAINLLAGIYLPSLVAPGQASTSERPLTR